MQDTSALTYGKAVESVAIDDTTAETSRAVVAHPYALSDKGDEGIAAPVTLSGNAAFDGLRQSQRDPFEQYGGASCLTNASQVIPLQPQEPPPQAIASDARDRMEELQDLLRDTDHDVIYQELAGRRLHSRDRLSIWTTLHQSGGAADKAETAHFLLVNLVDRMEGDSRLVSSLWKLCSNERLWLAHDNTKLRDPLAFFTSIGNHDLAHAAVVMHGLTKVMQAGYLAAIHDAWGAEWLDDMPAGMRPQLSKGLLEWVSYTAVEFPDRKREIIESWAEASRRRSDPSTPQYQGMQWSPYLLSDTLPVLTIFDVQLVLQRLRNTVGRPHRNDAREEATLANLSGGTLRASGDTTATAAMTTTTAAATPYTSIAAATPYTSIAAATPSTTTSTTTTATASRKRKRKGISKNFRRVLRAVEAEAGTDTETSDLDEPAHRPVKASRRREVTIDKSERCLCDVQSLFSQCASTLYSMAAATVEPGTCMVCSQEAKRIVLGARDELLRVLHRRHGVACADSPLTQLSFVVPASQTAGALEHSHCAGEAMPSVDVPHTADGVQGESLVI